MAQRRDDAPPASTVFVGNLSYDLTDQDVIDHFSQVGPVKHVRIVTDRESGKPRGFGFIEFFDIPTAESAIRNLSGKDFNGRTIRIVYAEGGPGEFRFRDFDRSFDERGPPPPRNFDDRGGGGGGPRRPLRDRVVGGDLAYHASHGVAALMDAPLPAGAPADGITHLLARRSRAELYDYLAQMKNLLQRNPGQARQILVDNPQLAKAMFQMQIILGLVSNPLGDVAPKGVAPANLMPRHEPHGGQQQHGMGMGGPPQGMGGPGPADMMPPPHGDMGMDVPMHMQQQGPPQQMQGPPMGMQQQGAPMGMQGPPMGMQQQMPPMGMQGPPMGMQQQMPPMGMQGPPLPMQQQGQAYMQGPGLPMEQNGGMGMGMQPPYQPQGFMPPHQQQQQQPYMQPEPMLPPQQGGAGFGPPLQQGQQPPIDPRRMAAAPRPMVSLVPQQQQPMQQQPGPTMPMLQQQAPGPAPAMGAMIPEQQQALLQQVMSLTPQQIELLPPQQKAQVLALQQQLRGH